MRFSAYTGSSAATQRAAATIPAATSPSWRLGLAGHEREKPLGVGVALDQRPVIAELALEAIEIVDDAVVGEQASALREEMRVAGLDRTAVRG
jgi:hypothetical protein